MPEFFGNIVEKLAGVLLKLGFSLSVGVLVDAPRAAHPT